MKYYTDTKFLFLSILCAFIGSVLTAATNDRPPNVILILADDLGYETLSAYGGETFDTPVLDDLASDGLVFNYCYATPLCTPTRVSIMTGKYNHRNYTRFGLFPEEDADKTFGNVMKDAGYATMMAGKWQLGPNKMIEKMGFDETVQCDSWKGFYDEGKYTVNGKDIQNTENRYRPDIVNEYVLDFIERKQDEPFFVYYPFFLVHTPEEPSPDFHDKALIQKYKDGDKGTPDEFVFGDMLTYMDKLIGKVVDKLEETGNRENTIILFLGDNGTVGGHAGPPEVANMVVLNGKPHPTGGKGSLKISAHTCHLLRIGRVSPRGVILTIWSISLTFCQAWLRSRTKHCQRVSSTESASFRRFKVNRAPLVNGPSFCTT